MPILSSEWDNRRMRRTSHDPVLITTARESSEAEYEHRRRKYALMMSLRALAVIGAAVCYHVSIWISIGFVIAGAVLPWCAVIIANDGPPKKKRPAIAPVVPHERALPSVPQDRTIDADATEAHDGRD